MLIHTPICQEVVHGIAFINFLIYLSIHLSNNICIYIVLVGDCLKFENTTHPQVKPMYLSFSC